MHIIQKLKARMQERGVTQTDIAGVLGRDKSVVTLLFQGKRRLKWDEAEKIAAFLDVPLPELMENFSNEEAVAVSGMAEPYAIPFRAAPSMRTQEHAQVSEKSGTFFLSDHGIDMLHAFALEIGDTSLNLSGILPGDIVISALNATYKSGDTVIVQLYGAQGDAQTVLRRYQPPMLLPHSTDAEHEMFREEDEAVRIVSPLLKLVRLY